MCSAANCILTVGETASARGCLPRRTSHLPSSLSTSQKTSVHQTSSSSPAAPPSSPLHAQPPSCISEHRKESQRRQHSSKVSSKGERRQVAATTLNKPGTKSMEAVAVLAGRVARQALMLPQVFKFIFSIVAFLTTACRLHL